MEFPEKIVDFRYCDSCKFKDVADYEDPCNECLNNPTNLHSVKPINYKKKEVKTKKQNKKG